MDFTGGQDSAVDFAPSAGPEDGHDAPALDAQALDASGAAFVIGAAGGVATAIDGITNLTFPPGALAQETTVTITKVSDGSAETLGPIYEIGPSGLTFAQPVLIRLPWSGANIVDVLAATGSSGTTTGPWTPVLPSVVSVADHATYALVQHLSAYTNIKGGSAPCCPSCMAAACAQAGGIPHSNNCGCRALSGNDSASQSVTTLRSMFAMMQTLCGTPSPDFVSCPACDGGADVCAGDGGLVCANLLSDTQNCGTCGHVCAAIYQCIVGQCACALGLTLCGSSCVDRTTDAANCGTCGHACGATQICQSSACGCTAGQVVCPSGACATSAAGCT